MIMRPTTFSRTHEVFIAFLKLGLYAFGGPVAHIAHFRSTFVEKRRWLSDQQFSQMIAICQFLPGPSSSQLGFSIGLIRAGGFGALAAFIGFTLPSVLLLLLCALGIKQLPEHLHQSCIDGLKLIAGIVVAQAVISMFLKLCDQVSSKLIALLSMLVVLTYSGANQQIACLVLGAFLGFFWLKSTPQNQLAASIQIPYGKRIGLLCIGLFAALFAGLSIPQNHHATIAELFYRAGALVFGGGHVVLPLLQTSLVDPGLMSPATFLSGYGIAQALPGPIFSVSAYYGYQVGISESCALSMASTALIAIFLPGFLLVAGILPFWNRVYQLPRAYALLGGLNAAVVGILAATLYNPIWKQSMHSLFDVSIGIVGLLAIRYAHLPIPWLVLSILSIQLIFR